MPTGWPLTGRTEELATVLTHIRGRGVVLAGSAGVGKTRLAREALRQARRTERGWRYVAATASARTVPLGAFADYATHLGEDPLARIGDVVGAITRSTSGLPLVVIDDAHLLDEHSALVAHQIVRRRLATVVLTVRSGEQTPDAITALWKDNLLPRLEVQPLSRNETGRLLETALTGPVESATAERLWSYTRGNVLYLRQLLADELATGHLTQRSGVWIWDTDPTVSPTLAELIDANIGRQPQPVLDVLDALAVTDSLELATLRAVANDDAVEQAEAANLITIDTRPIDPIVRLAHPMYGEVRRVRAPALRLRRLRSAILESSPPLTDQTDLVQLVRRAVLHIDSDTPTDPELLIHAASAAIQLLDPMTAERIARHAAEHGGGVPAQLVYMNALANGDRLHEALLVNSRLRAAATTRKSKAALGLIRVGILLRRDGSLALRELGQLEDLAMGADLATPYMCLSAVAYASTENPHKAVDAAIAGISGSGPITDAAEFTGILGLVIACRELGRIDSIRDNVDRGYSLASISPDVPTSRFTLYLVHAEALRLAGFVAEATEVANRLAQEPMEFPLALAFRALVFGEAAAGRGDLNTACRFFTEAAAAAEPLNLAWIRTDAAMAMATAVAMAGGNTRGFDTAVELRPHDPFAQRFEYAELAQAWVSASEGLVSEAITLATVAARRARSVSSHAREVCCLQTVAQFGDSSGADRLAELITVVQGPRVAAAAAHAGALRNADGHGLLAAARSYETFGDCIAAGDAAAQAAVVFRGQGRRGSAMTASGLAQRLADDTGADTPALRANDFPIPLTQRQREIIALAAQNLSNRQIAERLTMSVRTVEGHLFRASQRTGVNSREELIALVDSRV